MAKNLFITGQGRVGKTLIAIALATKIRRNGMNVSYFKPVGEMSLSSENKRMGVDADAVLMKQKFAISHDEKEICPIVRTMGSFDEFLKIGTDKIMNRIRRSYEKIAEGMDYVIIEGARTPWTLLHVGIAVPQLVNEFKAQTISVVPFLDLSAMDEVLLQRDFFAYYDIKNIHIILNMVPPILRGIAKEKIGPMLREFEIQYVGTIPHSKELSSPTIRDILLALGGTMIVGEDKLDTPIIDFFVGSMAPENALKWFRRSKNKAVITGGDRADLCLTAMETDTNLLILTGNLNPDVRTIARAQETGTAIMVTEKDTFTTSQTVDRLIGSIHPEDRSKIARIEKIVDEALDYTVLGL